MKKLAAGLGALIVVVLVAAMVLPAFIDWNQYRARIASEASDALGRTVEIRGDIGLSLLPTPVFYVKQAHLANVEGAADADMVALDSLEVRIAWAPLLVGAVRIEAVKLVRPVVNIERMEGGRSNLTFERRAADRRTTGLKPKIPLTTGVTVETSDDGGMELSIDNFVVEKGTVVFRDSGSDRIERIENVNGRFSIGSLRGPFNAVASAVVRGVPLSMDVEAGTIIQGRTMPLSVDLAAVPGTAKAQFSGSLNSMDESPRLKGRVTLEGENLQEFAGALGIALPDATHRSFGAVGNLSAGMDGGEVADLGVRLDGTQGQGRLAVGLEPKRTIEATLAVTRVDLDALLAPASTPARSPAPAKADAESGTRGIAIDVPLKTQGGRFSLAALPDDLSANLTVAIEALTWRGDAIRQAKLSLSLDNAEVTVNQLTALLPGGSDVALFGFVTERDATPQFDGTLDISTADLRGTLDWLGASTSSIPYERLRRLGVSAKLSARPGAASLSDMHATLDGTKIDGAATVEFSERVSVGADVALDRINLDGYLPGAAVPAPQDGSPASAPAPAAAPPQPAATLLANPLAQLTPLGAFDADLRARAASITYKGLPFKDMRLEASLRDGVLDVKLLSMGDLVGVSGTLSGGVTGLKRPASGAADPAFKDMVLDAKGKSLGALVRMAGIELPVAPEALGASALTLRLNGNPKALDLALEVATMGGKGSLSGKLLGREMIPRVDGRFAIAHPDFVRLVRGFGIDYRPKAAKGSVDLAGRFGGSILELGVSDIVGTVAGTRVQGSAGMALLGRKPRIAVKLATSDLDVDAFLPQRRAAALEDRPRVMPAAFGLPAPPPGSPVRPAAAPWSNNPIDLRPLALVDGTIAVRSDSLSYGGFAVANADLDAELKDGAVLVRRLIGKSYGGDLTVDGALAPDGDAVKFQARFALGGADIGAAERAFGGKGRSTGRLTSEGQLAGSGRTSAELVGSLAGEGALAVRGLTAGDGAGVLGSVVGAIDRIAAVLGGGQRTGLLDLSGPYRVTNGVVGFDELAFTSALGEGALKGTIDLPKWQVATRGEIRLDKALLAELTLRDAAAKAVPFEVEGSLDAPRVKVDIAKLPGGGVRVPLDRLRERIAPKAAAPKAPARPVPPVTEEAAPPPAKPRVQEPAPKAEPAPPAQPEPKRAERAQDILRDILKGIGR